MISLGEQHFGPRDCVRETRERLANLSFEHFDVIPQSPCLGAEVRGIGLADDLSDEIIEALGTALVEFKVLFFRDQDIDVHAQNAFASRFGALEQHPFLPAKDEATEVIRFEKDENTRGVENVWHSDVSWRQIPSLGSILHGLEIPAIGGDTLWADMEAAYEGLDDTMKERIEGLEAEHSFVRTFGLMLSPEQRAEREKEFPPAIHPVVRTHPVSGRRCIYVNPVFTSHIVGIPEEESDELLGALYRQATVPEYQCRFRWSNGSVAFWDNRSTQHYAASDYFPQRRVAERVTIIGDRPV